MSGALPSIALIGDHRAPAVGLRYSPDHVHPVFGSPVEEWLARGAASGVESRVLVPGHKCVIYGFGLVGKSLSDSREPRDPVSVLLKAGFPVDGGTAQAIRMVARPMAHARQDSPRALLRPRLLGGRALIELLGVGEDHDIENPAPNGGIRIAVPVAALVDPATAVMWPWIDGDADTHRAVAITAASSMTTPRADPPGGPANSASPLLDTPARTVVTVPIAQPVPQSVQQSISQPLPQAPSGPRPVSARHATLCGTSLKPELRLAFTYEDRLPDGTRVLDWVKALPGRRYDPGAKAWFATGFGQAGQPGTDPALVLGGVGFTIDIDPPDLDESLRATVALADYQIPHAVADPDRPGIARVYPRFAGWHVTQALIGSGAIWDKHNGFFVVPATDLLRFGEPITGVTIERTLVEAAREALTREVSYGHSTHDDETIRNDAARAALASGIDPSRADTEALDRLIDVVGDVPEWVGHEANMKPWPYQRLGALAMLAGRTLLCDPPGLGKTVQILAVTAASGSRRAVLVVPPVVVTNWKREAEMWGLTTLALAPPPLAFGQRHATQSADVVRGEVVAVRNDPRSAPAGASGRTPEAPAEPDAPIAPPSEAEAGSTSLAQDSAMTPTLREVPSTNLGHSLADGDDMAPTPREVVVFKAGRKEPALPDVGIVIVPDSLLASRPALVDRLADWAPDVFAYDEAHRARTWTGKRSQTIRDLVARLPRDTISIAATGTPLFSNPAELAPLLAISGHLDRVFGGYRNYIDTYCVRDRFNALQPNKKMLPQLRQILDEKVWVRRDKDEVLPDLPALVHGTLVLDVDLSDYRVAHGEVLEKIEAWIDSYVNDTEANPTGALPDSEVIEAWAKSNVGIVSPLRRAAGMAKIPTLIDMIGTWIDANTPERGQPIDRPLLVWVHHQDAVAAILRAVRDARRDVIANPGWVQVIDGATSPDKRGRIVDDFQAGKVMVLICSITAAGVGITLTRGSDQIFLETDWSPPLVSQAVDRQRRIGQNNPVNVMTLVADNTLDAHIHRVLQRKAEVLSVAIGDKAALETSNIDLDTLEISASPSAVVIELVNKVVSGWAKTQKKKKAA